MMELNFLISYETKIIRYDQYELYTYPHQFDDGYMTIKAINDYYTVKQKKYRIDDLTGVIVSTSQTGDGVELAPDFSTTQPLKIHHVFKNKLCPRNALWTHSEELYVFTGNGQYWLYNHGKEICINHLGLECRTQVGVRHSFYSVLVSPKYIYFIQTSTLMRWHIETDRLEPVVEVPPNTFLMCYTPVGPIVYSTEPFSGRRMVTNDLFPEDNHCHYALISRGEIWLLPYTTNVHELRYRNGILMGIREADDHWYLDQLELRFWFEVREEHKNEFEDEREITVYADAEQIGTISAPLLARQAAYFQHLLYGGFARAESVTFPTSASLGSKLLDYYQTGILCKLSREEKVELAMVVDYYLDEKLCAALLRQLDIESGGADFVGTVLWDRIGDLWPDAFSIEDHWSDDKSIE